MAAQQSDVVVIGSGFGGTFAALELIKAGCSVTLLERGPWRDTVVNQKLGIKDRASLPRGMRFFSHVVYRLHHKMLPKNGLQINRRGLMEVFVGEGVRAICSSGVGGGSHVYSALHDRPLRSDYWDNVADGLSSEILEPYYRAALTVMDSHKPTGRGGCETPALPDGFYALPEEKQPHLGYLLDKPRETTPYPNYREKADFHQEGMFGSYAGGKTTLDFACLFPAMEKGLKLFAEQEVVHIQRLANGGFEVQALDKRKQFQRYQAKRVVVAAGALNTVSLLLKSRAQGGLLGMPALGVGFGSNGDAMAQWAVKTPGVDHTQAGVYERIFRHQDDDTGPIFMQAGVAGLSGIPMPNFLRKQMREQLFVAGMGEDAADGILDWHNGRLRIRYDASNSPIFARIDQHFKTLTQTTDARVKAPRTPITVHPLSGARAGDNIECSVVNGLGEVHDNKGLYITDAAALPGALGTAPSLSIAAWAQHVAVNIALKG